MRNCDQVKQTQRLFKSVMVIIRMQDKKQESILKTTMPKTTHVNKVLVSVIVAAVVLLIAVAIVSALGRAPQKVAKTHQATQNLTTAVSSVVTALPQNYQDVDKKNNINLKIRLQKFRPKCSKKWLYYN